LILAVGIERLQVVTWLPDDPYPRALVEQRGEPDEPTEHLRVEEVGQSLRKLLALMSEAGYDVGDLDYQVSDEPRTAAYQLCALAPVSALDAYGLLEVDSLSGRLDRLHSLFTEEIELLQQQLAGG
jgi:Lon protease-like protein